MSQCPKCKANYKSSFGTNNKRIEYKCGSCFGGDKGFAGLPPIDYQTPVCLANQLHAALGQLMDVVGDMPADPNDCWPEEWAAARQALEDYRKAKKNYERLS